MLNHYTAIPKAFWNGWNTQGSTVWPSGNHNVSRIFPKVSFSVPAECSLFGCSHGIKTSFHKIHNSTQGKTREGEKIENKKTNNRWFWNVRFFPITHVLLVPSRPSILTKLPLLRLGSTIFPSRLTSQFLVAPQKIRPHNRGKWSKYGGLTHKEIHI